jgi:lactoylglutathione lyase
MSAHELRLVLTVEDFDAALALFRDALGLEEVDAWEAQAGRIAILAAGRATLELVDEAQAEAIDEIEVRRRVAGPVETPWHDRNVRLELRGGIKLTLFSPAH